MTPLLEIRDLTKTFGGLHALHDLDLAVEPGEVVSVIGPNGAGKTTLFNVVSGLYEPDRGAVLFEGRRLAGLKPNAITRLGIARTFQAVRLFSNMTVIENVMVGQHCRTRSGIFSTILALPSAFREEERSAERARRTLAFFGSRLAGFRHDMPAVSLSYANRRRLEIARALATDPKLLLLDEPTAGMNPVETREMIELIGRLREELGLTIMVIEHDMRVVKGVSDRVIALDYGQKIADGRYEEVAHNPRVVEAYLGRKATTQA